MEKDNLLIRNTITSTRYGLCNVGDETGGCGAPILHKMETKTLLFKETSYFNPFQKGNIMFVAKTALSFVLWNIWQERNTLISHNKITHKNENLKTIFN